MRHFLRPPAQAQHRDDLAARIQSHPHPQLVRLVAQRRTQLIQLHVTEEQVMEEVLVNPRCVFPSPCHPRPDRLLPIDPVVLTLFIRAGIPFPLRPLAPPPPTLDLRPGTYHPLTLPRRLITPSVGPTSARHSPQSSGVRGRSARSFLPGEADLSNADPGTRQLAIIPTSQIKPTPHIAPSHSRSSTLSTPGNASPNTTPRNLFQDHPKFFKLLPS